MAQFETHTFNLWQVAGQEFIPDLVLQSKVPQGEWGVEFLRDPIMSGILARIHGFIASRKHSEIVSYPADWWEAFKERWAPKWFLRRYPVRFTSKELDARTIWPNFPYPLDWGKPIQFVEVRDVWAED
jgi:hypothetical protein